MKWYLALGLLIVGTAAIGGVWTRFSSAVDVEAAPVESGPVWEVVDERAVTRLPATYVITMPFDGRVEPITLAEGSPVKEGQVVARIMPLDLELALQEAQKAIEILDAQIVENDDVSLERVSLQQALSYVESMSDVVKAAAAQVTSGQEKYQYATKRRQRLERLAESGATTEDDLDRARMEEVQSDVEYRQDNLIHSALVAMQAATNLVPTLIDRWIERKQIHRAVLVKQKEQAEVQLRQLEVRRERGTMHSPVDGVVLERLVQNEQTLPAGAELLRIGRLEDLQIEADVLTQDAVRIRTGSDVEIYGPAVGEPAARGSIERINPAGFTKISSLGVEQQRVAVVVRVARQDLERLLQGRQFGVAYHVRVRIVTDEKSHVLRVPRPALFRGPAGEWRVFAIRNGAAVLQDVEIGLMNDHHAEVKKGLSEGEQVVVAPPSTLQEGSRLHIMATK